MLSLAAWGQPCAPSPHCAMPCLSATTAYKSSAYEVSSRTIFTSSETIGKAHAVAGVYPMASIRSRSARKLTANAPAPMAAVALTAQQ